MERVIKSYHGTRLWVRRACWLSGTCTSLHIARHGWDHRCAQFRDQLPDGCFFRCAYRAALTWLHCGMAQDMTWVRVVCKFSCCDPARRRRCACGHISPGPADSRSVGHTLVRSTSCNSHALSSPNSARDCSRRVSADVLLRPARRTGGAIGLCASQRAWVCRQRRCAMHCRARAAARRVQRRA